MGRRAYVISRFLQMIPTVLILVILVFMMIRLIPGDPAVTMLGVQATPERVAEVRKQLGLDRSLPVQFGIFIRDLARADLGNSITVRTPVIELVKQRLPMTMFLVVYSMVLAVVMTVPLAVIAATHRDRFVDQCIRTFSMVMISTPGFWIGLLLLILLGVKTSIFPVGGAGDGFIDRLFHLFLPSLTLALHVAAVLTRNLREALLNTMSAEHANVARAKGLRESRVLITHVLRNAMISTVTLFGLYIGWLVGGSVIIESVFALPGMGSMMLTAIMARDYQVVQGFTLVYAILVSVVYLVTDLTYSFLDPRVTL